MRIRSYSGMRALRSFDDRFRYLSLNGSVGEATFGFDRWINQQFYRSREWKQVRNEIITRDNGCDLGVLGYEIHDRPIVHHMNPMTASAIERGDQDIMDPEFLVLVTHRTHNAIHYGDESLLRQPLIERQRGDTKLW